MTPAERAALSKRITDYLSMGGLFNPEMANHDAVRDLLIDCRAALALPVEEAAPAKCARCDGVGRTIGRISRGVPVFVKCPSCGGAPPSPSTGTAPAPDTLRLLVDAVPFPDLPPVAPPPGPGACPECHGRKVVTVGERPGADSGVDVACPTCSGDGTRLFGAPFKSPAPAPTPPPPPDYDLGQERMRERAAVALPLELLRHLRGTLLQEAEGLEGVVTEDRLRLMAWLALLNDAIRIRSLPLEAASEGVRSCLWHADCDAADRALRDGVSPSHPPWPAPAAQTTPEPNRAPDGGCTCHFCAAPPRDAGHNEGEG